MTKLNKNYRRRIVFLCALFAFCASAAFAQNSITLSVDATGAARNVLRVRETMPVRAGRLTLFYPKWIPGEHTPTGTINDVVNFAVSANGKNLAWTRDDAEMFAFHLNVPADAREIEISFDDVSQPGTIASAQLSRIKWNRLLVYPQGAKADDVQVTASMKLPAGWKYATALPVARESTDAVDFKPVSLNFFVDSPAVIGKNFKRVELSNYAGAMHEIDIFADNAESLRYKPETLAGWRNLVAQANALFGARHYDKYKFLLTLSDVGGSEGLEHHESSEDGVGEKALSDPLELMDLGGLLGHEFAHSWNGKYRRPAGLATGDYESVQKAELLWVYEGLTQYLGNVLPARSGLWTPEIFRDTVAENAASMDFQTGRNWRPVADTSRSVQLTYSSPRAWRNARRGADYYVEGMLIWLEADVLIRQKSNGKLSLDDFCRRFHGRQNTPPQVLPYNLDEVTATLNQVLPYDWRAFFDERIYSVKQRAPMGGITNGGWRLVFNETPNVQNQFYAQRTNSVNLSYSIGLNVASGGAISDVNPQLAAGKAGLAPGMKITSVNGQDFTIEALTTAITQAKNTRAPVQIIADNGGFKETYNLDYHDGLRYPHLERVAARADLLSEIIKPRNPHGFILQSFSSSRRKTVNKPADVTNVVFSQTEITANCPTNSTGCSDGKRVVEISVDAVDAEGDVLEYNYTVSGGKVTGKGAKVVWDLSGAKPGTYTITAAVDDGCGFCGAPMTKTVTVKECADCKDE